MRESVNKGIASTATVATSPLVFIGITPCRLVDTRDNTLSSPFGPPSMSGGQTRTITVPTSTRCSIPSSAQAYSLNFTVVPRTGFLGYLSTWPDPNRPSPLVSILNDLTGLIIANAAVVPAGNSGAIDVFVTDPTDVIIDINGYYTTQTGNGSQPVGTVIYSMLDQTTFQSQVNPGEWWLLADGRSIAGFNLKYETLTQQSNIPNLLGVFIRGKNNGRADGNQNPDGDLALGQFSPDKFASHNHGGVTGTDSPDHTHGFGGYQYGVNYGGDNTAMNLGVSPNGFYRYTDGASTRHTHAITPSGGNETAPKSVTLNPFIRVN